MNGYFIKKLIGSLLYSISLLTVGSSYASESFAFKLTPYGGFDVGQQNTKFRPSFGENLFKNKLPKGNFFVGLKFNDYLGVEGGYETTLERKRDVTFTGGDHDTDYLGAGLATLVLRFPDDVAKISNKSKISGWHLGITGEYPIYFSNQQKHSLSLLGYVGMKHTTIKLSSNVYYNLGAPDLQSVYVLNKDNTKNLFRLSAGLQYFVHQNIGLRIMGTWENTSKLNPKGYGYQELLQAKLKNSLGYTIGIVFKS